MAEKKDLTNLIEQYKALFKKEVPSNKKNDEKWITKKVGEKIAKNYDKNAPEEIEEEVVETKKSEKKVTTKIKLKQDTGYGEGIVEKGTVLELSEKELEKFPESFYELV